MTTIVAKDQAIVRTLAGQVAELAASERNRRNRQRWCDVNALRKPDRAPVWCRPVGAWDELLPETALECADPWMRAWEREFRRVLIKHDIGDDTPLEPWFEVGVVLRCDPPNMWGVDVQHIDSGAEGGAWAYAPPLKTGADLDRLRMPEFTCDTAATERELNRAGELLADILPVRVVSGPPISATLGTYAADLHGLQEMMVSMMASPELMHRLMGHLRDAALAGMRAVEESGLLSANNTGPMTCSEPVGPHDGPVTYKNCWVMANSQEFDAVGPAMWREFCLEYQRPVIEQFGMSGYGCCENLTHKIDDVMSLSNLRIFVCSAWTDLDTVIDRVGTDYVIMWRQKASDVVFPDGLDTVRRDLEAGARRLQGCRYQIVLRELQTLAGHPQRLHDWTRLAIDAAETWA